MIDDSGHRSYELEQKFPLRAFEQDFCGWEDHMHYQDYLQLGLCLKGKGKFHFTDREYSVFPGDIVIVDNYERHIAITEPPDVTRYLFIIFLPEFIAPPGSNLFDVEYLSPFWYSASHLCNKIDGRSETAVELAEDMKLCRQIWKEKSLGYRHAIDALVRTMLARLMRHFKTMEMEQVQLKIKNYMKMQPAIDFITRNFNKNISLESASGIINMSPSRFRHLFKEVTRIGFKEYIINKRINEAKKLLVTGDMNITDIMYQVGFSNTYQFYQSFQRQVSMTPAEFRDKISGVPVQEWGGK